MTVQLPENAHDLLTRPITAILITVMPDGQPQATPVWFDYDGQYIRINSAEGRQKVRNMSRDSKVTVMLLDPQNPFHWLEWRGHIQEVIDATHGAEDHIRLLAMRYTGSPEYQLDSDAKRIMYLIAADKVNVR